MTDYEREKIDIELKRFTTLNFEKPAACRDLQQIRFYVRELCEKIEELKGRADYVPVWAYALLAQYNARQNAMLQVEFKDHYR